jgi:hypothetical protein
MARVVDNNGIGALYATFTITKTGETPDLDASNIGDAVGMGGHDAVNHGSDGIKLLGRLEHVSDDIATVQISGVMNLPIDTGESAPFVGNGVVINGAGKVYRAPAIDPANGDPAGGNVARGTVLSVDYTTNTCDILL